MLALNQPPLLVASARSLQNYTPKGIQLCHANLVINL